MASLRSDELERILHPVRDENYMKAYAEAQVDLLHRCLLAVESGEAVSYVEGKYWEKMNELNQLLADQRGSLEWYTLTEGDTVRICTDSDPLPFFTSPDNDDILCDKYGITRNTHSFNGLLREGLVSERGFVYDSSTHNYTTVSQITRKEHDHIIEKDHRDGFTSCISDSTGWGPSTSLGVFDSRRLLGYLSIDDHDASPRVVLFAYDKNWNLMYDSPVFDGYTSQNLLVPFTSDHEAYDRAIEDLKEDMASRRGLTLREGWPKP